MAHIFFNIICISLLSYYVYLGVLMTSTSKKIVGVTMTSIFWYDVYYLSAVYSLILKSRRNEKYYSTKKK